MSEIALSCTGLVKRYADVVAVDGLDLEVRRGECFGLLGPNGAGKTTTVEIFEGLNEPDAGEVRVLGLDWKGHEATLRQRLGIQLQETKFTEKLTVRETITMFRSFYRDGLSPDEALDAVALQEKADAWVKKLSGGQRQRLSLACAIVGDPELLFLDEPSTGLDPQSRRKIWDIVAGFRDRDRTVLLTTHYMDEAERLCDRVAIVDRGKRIAQGTPRELIASLGAEHVVEFRTEPALELAGIDELGAIDRVDGTHRARVRHVHRALPALLDEVRRREATLSALSTHSATLEDVFVSLTGRQLRDG